MYVIIITITIIAVLYVIASTKQIYIIYVIIITITIIAMLYVIAVTKQIYTMYIRHHNNYNNQQCYTLSHRLNKYVLCTSS